MKKIAENLLNKLLKIIEKKSKSYNMISCLINLFIQSKRNKNGPILNLFYNLQMKNSLNGLDQDLNLMEKEKKQENCLLMKKKHLKLTLQKMLKQKRLPEKILWI